MERVIGTQMGMVAALVWMFVAGSVASAQTGACCLGDASCVDTDASGCALGAGDFVGEGTSCENAVCTGACCLADKLCMEEARDDCTDGTFQGPGTTCDSHCASYLGAAFTYQGQLKQNGIPVNGLIDVEAAMWTTPIGGEPVGGLLLIGPVNVTNGLFIVELDFGPNMFNGNARWLEIAVRHPHDPNDAEPFTTLSPRQPLTPSPYALALPGLYTQPNDTCPNVIGGYKGNLVDAGRVGATIAGGGAGAPWGINRVTEEFGTVGGGRDNTAGNAAVVGGGATNEASGSLSTIAGGGGNNASDQMDTVGGGGGNTASGGNSTVAGGFFNTASGGNSTVGGGDGNTAGGINATVGGGEENSANAIDSTVGGGQYNVASGNSSTVAGGDGNTASGTRSTVGGGEDNTASGSTSTVGGGLQNAASSFATVGGGANNTAHGTYATVGGGDYNTASGTRATVPGGNFNQALGNYSFAAGYRAKANHSGSFVWGDTTTEDFISTGPHQFLIRATGGVGIGINDPQAQLHVSGGNTILEQEPWQVESLENGWVNYENGYAPAAYFRDSTGIVHLRGLVRNGTVGNDSAILTLPAGYRPAYRAIFAVKSFAIAVARVDVFADGRVVAMEGSPSYLSLEGISFRAEQ